MKQEEIRTGRYSIINNHTRGILTPSQRRGLNKAIEEYEDSKGVVIKVDRELPFVTSDFMLSEHGVYAKVGKGALSEQGYVAVEPLIDTVRMYQENTPVED